MSQPPEFFKPTSAGAWVGFATFFVVLALIWPWLWGLLAGIGAFYALFYTYYRMLGGK